MMKTNKIILIGSGAVGCSFLYSAINNNLANEYGIIDINEKNVDGQVLDFEDAIFPSNFPYKIYKASYKDCKDADIIVITAGRPQLPGESRLNMVEGNALIIKGIAQNVKKSGFKGITIIASNPVDILTYIYQKITSFDWNKVIGTGTSLDTSRLAFELSKKLNISPQSINTYVIGEHGDSSTSVFSSTTIGSISLKEYMKQFRIKEFDFKKVHETVWKKAYEIIDRKGATFYGIGMCITNICENIINDSNNILVVSSYLNGQYGFKNIYTGVPVIINNKGVKEIIELNLSKDESKQFNKSTNQLKEIMDKTFKFLIKNK